MWGFLGGVLDAFGIALAVLSFVCAGLVMWLAIWFAGRIIGKWREADHIVAAWPRVQATVTSAPVVQRWVPDVPGGVPTVQAQFSFTDIHQVSHTGRDVEYLLSGPVIGSQVEVAYDPADPGTHHLTHRMRGRVWSWGVLAIAVDVLLVGCAVLFVWLGMDAVL